MSEWVEVSEAVPDVKPAKHGEWKESEKVAVTVKGHEKWQTAHYVVHPFHEGWCIHGFNGDYRVTHWYQLPQIKT